MDASDSNTDYSAERIIQMLATNVLGQRSVAGVPSSVAHCASFGFETYRSGWHAFIVIGGVKGLSLGLACVLSCETI